MNIVKGVMSLLKNITGRSDSEEVIVQEEQKKPYYTVDANRADQARNIQQARAQASSNGKDHKRVMEQLEAERKRQLNEANQRTQEACKLRDARRPQPSGS